MQIYQHFTMALNVVVLFKKRSSNKTLKWSHHEGFREQCRNLSIVIFLMLLIEQVQAGIQYTSFGPTLQVPLITHRWAGGFRLHNSLPQYATTVKERKNHQAARLKLTQKLWHLPQ